jgi:hypothetical protein
LTDAPATVESMYAVMSGAAPFTESDAALGVLAQL